MWAAGIIITGAGISATLRAGWGVGPFDLTVTALTKWGLPLGSAILTAHLACLCIAAIATRTPPAATTLAAGAGLAATIWAASATWNLFSGEPAGTSPALSIAGIITIGIGAGLQISARVGPSPLEAATAAVAQRTGSIIWARMILEGGFAIFGTLGGGNLGWGTLISITTTGPVIAATRRAVTRLG